MKVLLVGGSGFIGRHLLPALAAAGHEVWTASRRSLPDAPRHLVVDFADDKAAARWADSLAGFDVVVNAVGIIREQGRQTFEAVHTRSAIALFDACARAGVRRVIQISALGADEQAQSRYHRSKRDADAYLLRLPLSAAVVQPSLIFGVDGASAAMFARLASLPVIPVPGQGRQRVQPIHVDDVVAALVALVEARDPPPQRLALVGPRAMDLRDMLADLRTALGLGRGRFLPVPIPLMRLGARLAQHVPGALLDPETLGMLERGNTADAGETSALLGRPPRPVRAFLSPSEARGLAATAMLGWLLPLLRVSVAIVWLISGIVSMGLYPVEQSYELLARSGIPEPLRPLALYGAAALDIAFGLASLFVRRPGLWLAQLALILGYTLIISLRLPEFWLHPYAPLAKNLPMVAVILLLYAFDRRRWTT